MQEALKPINTPDTLFHDGNPTTGELGTIVSADWLNNLQQATRSAQEELISLIKDSGQTLDANRRDQLLQAVKQLAWGGNSKPTTLAGYGIGDGATKAEVSVKADKASTLAGYGIQDGITVGMLPRRNLLADGGRFFDPFTPEGIVQARTNPITVPFAMTMHMASYSQSANSVGRFIHDNGSFEGPGPKLVQPVLDLLDRLGREREQKRYGFEFHIAELRCGALTYSPGVFDGKNMAIAMAYGVGTEGPITFMSWLRCISGSIYYDCGQYRNGKPMENKRITPSDGWVHMAGVTDWGRGYSNSHIYAENNSIFQLALPAALSGNHLGYVHKAPIAP
ncbi:hypothetical protein ACSVCE_21380 [Chromobacterium haemolyticum]|uniref:hypothetical protein n=1 Tax=Chromobacterium haemolyticum TaxID=394935 RepID=UPI0013198C90|nr:hypothetical protein [Chromobacterium haemolyticum]BBH15324.1 hypothetical protein CH06BL_45720 [Chromobacterium haemolyticum]